MNWRNLFHITPKPREIVLTPRAPVNSKPSRKGWETRRKNAVYARLAKFKADPLIQAVLCKEHVRLSPEKRNAMRSIIFLRDGPGCFHCGRYLQITDHQGKHFATLDHLVPHFIGGSNEADNLVLSCSDCNELRGKAVQRIPLKVAATMSALNRAAWEAKRAAR